MLRRWHALRRSVRGKLIGMVMLITVAVLLVSGIALLAYDLSVYRTSWAADVASEAGILALSTAPALAFDDHDVAERNLAALRARPGVLLAALYLPDGRVYAQYAVRGEPPAGAAPEWSDGIRIRGQRVEVAQRIEQNGEFLGTIYLRAHYDVASRLKAYLGIFALITLLGLALALLLSVSLQRAVTVPLDAITGVARQIVDRGDYSLRVERRSDDEIGIVVQAFNSMLNEVQERTLALQRSNLSLTGQVAERIAAENALAGANARLEMTMAAAEIGSWVSDLRSGTISADRNFAGLYGYADLDSLLLNREPLYQRIHEADREMVRGARDEALRTGIYPSIEFRIVQPDESLRWVIGRGKLQLDADGQPQLLAGLLIDVTAQKLAEQQRRDSESVYRAIGESIDFGVWLTDEHGRCTYASDSFLTLTGLSQEQCTELGWGSALHPDDVAETMAAWQECVAKVSSWYREHRIRSSDGRYHAVLAQGVPIRRDNGKLVGWAGINLDISRLKHTEEALREADRRKDEFLATLAHELRNPLAPIRHATHVLGTDSATDEQRLWGREVIARQVQNMALLLDDLLDISRITRRRLDLKYEGVALAQLVESSVETARPLIESRRHRLELQLPAQDIQLNVDPLRIAQALSNLLTNAAKYTDAGGHIVLAVELDDDGLLLRVSDNGIGLAPASLSRVFEMFSQIEGALERSQGGLGIGLALVKGLIELHGGSINASSAGLGHGTMMTIRLPRALLIEQTATGRSDAPITTLPPGSRCTVLVADDNHDAADSLAILLRLQGHDVNVAYSGTQAVERATSLKPTAIVLDIGMPGMSGYEVARHIRAQSWGAGITLIALTGWGQKEDVERAQFEGFDHHFRKPVDFQALQQRLAGCA
jgi:two-component system CheB/CheR fusion protein